MTDPKKPIPEHAQSNALSDDQLAEVVGAPFDGVPIEMFTNGGAGYGQNSLCGCIGGAAGLCAAVRYQLPPVHLCAAQRPAHAEIHRCRAANPVQRPCRTGQCAGGTGAGG